MLKRRPVVLIALLAVAGCEKTTAVKEAEKIGTMPNLKEVRMDKIIVTSSAFLQAQAIPKTHAYLGEGENISPPLGWSGAPAGTRTYAIICDDPDAPSAKNPRPEPWVHWVVFNIPADQTALAAGNTGGGIAGRTDFKESNWGGPMPPPGSGLHRYFFKVYALDARLNLPSDTSKAQLLAAMQGHILASGELIGTYERK